jgi:sulfur relay (sulfurtransferase) complex TusBCD TusD component (DsrE family)
MANTAAFSNTVLVFTRDGMGFGERELQHDLLGKYLRLVVESEAQPAMLCFYTEGVRLVVAGSPFLERFAQLAQRGVPLLVCATCLNYYGLLDQVRVGTIGGMDGILAAQQTADKVITL